MAIFSVWIGGIEINDYMLTYAQANKLALKYINDGYDDVIIRIERE